MIIVGDKMSILKSVLEEELERNLRNQKIYKEMLSNLPKGSIYISNRNGKQYIYRKNRVGKKIINEYICALSNSEKAEEEIKKSEDYSRIFKSLNLAIKEELRLRKALKAYE
jgi:predicted subunit of tRNA(5-methylaminomethyl-2-thiouridylate) methyltransferase